MKEDREPKTKFTATTPPLFHCKIRKSHYVLTCIIHEYETRNVNKVNSEENSGSFESLWAKQTQLVKAASSATGWLGAKNKND